MRVPGACLPFHKWIPKLTDGPENQTLSKASKSTHAGALKLTSQGLQMDPFLVPQNRPPGAFKWTIIWCLKIDLPFCTLIPRPTDGSENQTLSRASKSTNSGALKSTFRDFQKVPLFGTLKSISRGLQMDLSLVPKNRSPLL